MTNYVEAPISAVEAPVQEKAKVKKAVGAATKGKKKVSITDGKAKNESSESLHGLIRNKSIRFSPTKKLAPHAQTHTHTMLDLACQRGGYSKVIQLYSYTTTDTCAEFFNIVDGGTSDTVKSAQAGCEEQILTQAHTTKII